MPTVKTSDRIAFISIPAITVNRLMCMCNGTRPTPNSARFGSAWSQPALFPR